MSAATVEQQRRQLQALYVGLIKIDGMASVHRLLSAAVIEARKPEPAKIVTMAWEGRTIQLGPRMARLNSRQMAFVLQYVHGGMNHTAAVQAAGYRGRKAGASLSRSDHVSAAIAEELARKQKL